jgi:hypothetical protein
MRFGVVCHLQSDLLVLLAANLARCPGSFGAFAMTFQGYACLSVYREPLNGFVSDLTLERFTKICLQIQIFGKIEQQ